MKAVPIVFVALGLLSAPEAEAKTNQKTLCADPNTKAFVGLAADENSYKSVEGAPQSDGVQKWTLVEEGRQIDAGPSHSFTGKFLQVLPDSGHTYPGQDVHLTSLDQLHGTPYISFSIQVAKKGVGWHTLFLRWTGGDSIGGGDSLYVALFKKNAAVSGERTLKPVMVPINDASNNKYAGCCYDPTTHKCPCFEMKPENATCPTFMDRDKAAGFGVQCHTAPGDMEFLNDPKWYLFAGQEEGNVMDFDSEPWDATCEARGSNTADSGRNFASWNLGKGDYELRIYAREDGTALDAIYLAGPNADAPRQTRFSEGQSTYCSHKFGSGLSSRWFLFVVLVVLGVSGFVFVTRTENGAELWTKVKTVVSRNPVSRETFLQQYHDMELQPENANI